MDEILPYSQNNNNSSNTEVSVSLGSSNYYESVLKKLNQIFKSKRSDSLKQLEDLWESVNLVKSTSPVPFNNSQVSTSTSTGESSLKRDISKLGTNSSTNQTVKKSKLSPVAPVKQPVPLPKPLSTNTLTKTSTNSNNSSQIKPQSTKTTDNSVAIDDNVESITVFSSSSTSNNSTGVINSSNLPDNIKFEDINSVVDMLDFSCITCKQFNQESNNKLIECRQCTKLFHQQCHNPKIEDSQLEKQNTSTNSYQLIWYVKKCEMCNSENKTKIVEASNDVEMLPEIAVQATITSDNSKNIVKNENSFDNSNHKRKLSNELASSNKQSQAINSSSNGIKGLAALATKLNAPNPTTNSSLLSKLQNTTNTSSNQDDLFKKFKQQTTNSATTAAPTNGITTNNKLVNGKKVQSGSSTTTTTTTTAKNSCSLASTNTSSKNNIFNLNSSTKPNLIAMSSKKVN